MANMKLTRADKRKIMAQADILTVPVLAQRFRVSERQIQRIVKAAKHSHNTAYDKCWFCLKEPLRDGDLFCNAECETRYEKEKCDKHGMVLPRFIDENYR